MVASFTHSKSKISTFIILHCFLLLAATSAQLSSDYYSKSCANALSIIQSVVQATVKNEARMGASLTRLHFHDCFVNGCDASNLLDDNANFTAEKTASPNLNSARGFEVIDTIKSQLEEACPGVVSCADIIAVAARDSVVALGGPRWTVLLGRRDSTTASLHAANSSIPGPFFNLSALIRSFSNKGLTSKEMVTLAGAHTIGRARCVIYRAHIYGDNNINSSFATSLQANCPRTSVNNNSSPLDLISSTTFDNAYYINLMNQRGLLHSDQQFFSGNGGSIDDHVSTYASNSSYFFMEFANAMVKMGNIGVLTGSSGQVRNHCRKIN